MQNELKKTHSYLGYFYGEKKDWDHAIQEYLQVLEIEPQDKDAHFNLGYLYLQKKQWKKAIREYEAEKRRGKVELVKLDDMV